MNQEPQSLGDRLRRVARELNEATERLNMALARAEEVFEERLGL